MPGYRMQAVVTKSPAEVFAVLADPLSPLRLLPGTTRCEPKAPGAVTAGGRVLRERTISGRTAAAEFVVSAFRQDKEIEFVAEAQGFRISYRYVLAAEGTGTKLTLDTDVRGSGLAALVAPAVASALEKADAGHLARI
jgi:carbon monoxide dehydrogenase subunit G